ncbi:MAG: sterol desaturase/sphingolipid hydroxylase (fatty acid hydroxylase superfamily) [Myxococcota bacterium]|jgi:sterol desaturase/sphingolipid hydroxylase (fatty acid hydroxylase superfamily)
MSPIIYIAIPFFGITLLLEVFALRGRRGHVGYEVKDTFASLAMGVGNVVLSALAKTAVVPLYFFIHEFALFEIEATALSFAALFVAEDFCYYWFHRFHHESRFFWAAHVNHHSSRHYNLSTALRQSLTTPLTGPLFWAPLSLLGFAPSMVAVAQAVSLIYQYWLHTELIGKLGPFEWVFNTPSHHRVHHGRNPQYLDRNYAGILIVWDRLFGSFEPEREAVDYGLTKNIDSFNLVTIGFHEWFDIARDLRRARSLREAWGFVFRAPGWSADGAGSTSATLRTQKDLVATGSGGY